MYGYIYKTTNLIDGKIYIDQKKSKRFLGNNYLGSGKRITSAIKKYGKDNFQVDLLEEIENYDLMDEREIFWIAYFDSTNKEIGYNISTGGNTRRAFTGSNHPMFGRDRSKENNPAYGRHWWTNGDSQIYSKECPEGFWAGVSNTTRQHHSDSAKGRDAWNKGLTKNIDNRLNGNSRPRSQELKDHLSKKLSGSGNACYGKTLPAQYKYIYDNQVFIGQSAIVSYLKEHGYPDFTVNNLNAIIHNKPLRKYPALQQKIQKIKMTQEERLAHRQSQKCHQP